MSRILHRWRWIAAALALFVVASVVVGVVKSRLETNPSPAAQTVSRESSGGTSQGTLGGGAVAPDAAPQMGASKAGPADQALGVPSGEVAVTDVLPPLGDRLIKSADLRVEVAKGKFEESFQKGAAVALAHGGDVIGSDSTAEKERMAVGTLTIRVPVKEFEGALRDLAGLGTVTNRTVRSEDVSQEYVDLQSRLRHWRVQETFYLGLMDRARSVSEAIQIQNALQNVQAQIEQIQGRLNFLQARTDYSTLVVTIAEKGTSKPKPSGEPSDLSRAWNRAVDGMATVAGGMLIVAAWVVPFVALALVVWGLVRLARWRPKGKRSE
ncbi:MAG: DUF4349 domain-containing protein [Actinomycetota bacterium]